MKIPKWNIFSSFLLFLSSAAALLSMVAQAAVDPLEKTVSGRQVQDLRQIADTGRSSPARNPKESMFDRALVQRINNIHAMLEQEIPHINDQLLGLKRAGYLGRRIKRDLEARLQETQAILVNLLDLLHSGELKRWQAPNIAQDLNYQADLLDTGLLEWPNDTEMATQDVPGVEGTGPEGQQLLETLSTISRMLHGIGQEMVRQAR